MKIVNIKSKVIIAIAALGFAVSATAANQPTTNEDIIAAYIANQSQQVMLDLSDQLQKSIATQLQNFSLKNVNIWLNDSDVEITVQETEQSNVATQTPTKLAEE